MGGVADEQHPSRAPRRPGRYLGGVGDQDVVGGGRDDACGRGGIVAQQRHQQVAPPARRAVRDHIGGQAFSGHAREPVGLPAGRHRVAEGGSAAAHQGDALGVGLLGSGGVGGVAVEDVLARVARLCGWSDRPADGGVQAIGADEQVTGRGAAVGEVCGDAVGAVLDGRQRSAVPNGDAPVGGLGLQGGVEFSATQAPVPQDGVVGLAERPLRELGAHAVEDTHRGQRETGRGDRGGGVDLGEGPHAVARQREEGADVLGRVGVRLVHGDVEACLVQGEGRRRTGDPAADDKYPGHYVSGSSVYGLGELRVYAGNVRVNRRGSRARGVSGSGRAPQLWPLGDLFARGVTSGLPRGRYATQHTITRRGHSRAVRNGTALTGPSRVS